MIKKILTPCLICLLSAVFVFSCKKVSNYPGGVVNDFMPIFDLRTIYHGTDVKLTKEAMFGGDKITGVVNTNHAGANLPSGIISLQSAVRLNKLRGIAINIGEAAASYQPGDSLVIDVAGGTLTKANGILQITGVAASKIRTVARGISLPLNRVTIKDILEYPDNYESVLCAIVKGSFNPLPAPTDIFEGLKIINDGFGDMHLSTSAKADFASKNLPINANYFGIVYNQPTEHNQTRPVLFLRTASDIAVLSSKIEIPPFVISGFIPDVKGGDGNYEYIQLMAVNDIDFATTPYSIVVCNNAGASTPTGHPKAGWGIGDKRSYKFDLTKGTAKKGTYFYVGGTGKKINGPSSTTKMDTLNWIRSFDYGKSDGDGFGTKTGGLFANSGNASGIAAFEGTRVDSSKAPFDVIFTGNGGTLYSAGPPALGYKIANTDWYDVINPITLELQPYYLSGTNTLNISYNVADQGYYNQLGGEYNLKLAKWTKARAKTAVLLTLESPVAEIEANATKLVE